jgi:hypothetical protein
MVGRSGTFKTAMEIGSGWQITDDDKSLIENGPVDIVIVAVAHQKSRPGYRCRR